ncbi:hypothetical protein ABIA69_001343 [Lysinibacillus parviboronicapiens]|uniref:DUF2812 domain-containing protein n=1 Tax=Lysinibacillus parviboronicapiens TaxID=436516 RepID=A0ABV2PHB9_9BACI|nr:DUF2812 domain-containing protein [Lysinibacillus parviboronicapiens]
MKRRTYRFFMDYEKEEAWVNDMAAQGWHLQKTYLGYFVFEQGESGQYIYRNEWINGRTQDYFDFLQSMNIECVSKFAGWAYYRKKAVDGPFELFSDAPSKINSLKSMNRLFIPLALLNVVMGILNITLGITGSSQSLLNTCLGLFNIIASMLLWVPIFKIVKRKKRLEQALHIFEG